MRTISSLLRPTDDSWKLKRLRPTAIAKYRNSLPACTGNRVMACNRAAKANKPIGQKSNAPPAEADGATMGPSRIFRRGSARAPYKDCAALRSTPTWNCAAIFSVHTVYKISLVAMRALKRSSLSLLVNRYDKAIGEKFSSSTFYHARLSSCPSLVGHAPANHLAAAYIDSCVG